MAVLFLAFDMEMVFMYPWAVVFVREGMTALGEMLMFILTGRDEGCRPGEWARRHRR